MYILSRSLYEVSEIKANIILALINKNSSLSFFWAFELFYSGFHIELTNFIIQIYYDFYYVLNPTFEKYMFVQLKKVQLDNELHDLALFIKIILDNLIHRPFTLDVFLLKNMGLQFDISFQNINDIFSEIIGSLFDENNYIYLTTILMKSDTFNDIKELNNLHSKVIDEMNKFTKINKNVKLKETGSLLKRCLKDDNILKRTIILAKIIHYYALKKQIKPHRSVYIENNYSEQISIIENYKTKSWKENAIYNSNQQWVGIFQLERFKKENNNFKHNFLNNWEIYAYNCPYWYNIFHKFNAHFDDSINKIIFSNSQQEDTFYETINCFPDEETNDIQNKFIGNIEQIYNLKHFYDFYKKNNVINFDNEDIEYLEPILL